MRTKHQTGALQVLSATPRTLRLEGAMQLQARHSGWLWVDDGTVGVTRGGGSVDHVLACNGSIYLGRGEQLVAEPWRSSKVVGLRWTLAADAQIPGTLRLPEAAHPSRPAHGAWAALAAAAWGSLASALRGAADRLAAAACRADAMASRAQRRIIADDSMASSCALQ